MIFKNQKTVIILSIIILFLVGIKSFGILDYFRMSTSTMEPAIHKDQIVLVTNLFKINKNDLIIFETEDFPGPVSFRVVGEQSDTVEIIEGVLFINGEKESEINKKLRQYKVSKNKFMQIKDSEEVIHPYESDDFTFIDTFLVVTNKEFANSMNLQKNVYDNMYEDKEIEKVYGKKWNRDNLGPLYIPENKFFVLGDHRGDSFDSRYFGLLDKKDIIGKILISL